MWQTTAFTIVCIRGEKLFKKQLSHIWKARGISTVLCIMYLLRWKGIVYICKCWFKSYLILYPTFCDTLSFGAKTSIRILYGILPRCCCCFQIFLILFWNVKSCSKENKMDKENFSKNIENPFELSSLLTILFLSS